jgi:hypothetical protein
MGKTIQLIDVPTDKVIKKMKLTRDAIGLHFGGNVLVFTSEIAEHEHLLSVWRVENSVNLTHIKDVAIGDYNPNNVGELDFYTPVQVDEHFIAVHTPIGNVSSTCKVISLKTFEIVRSLSCAVYLDSYYNGGYLLLIDCIRNRIRMLDVVSGTFLHDIPLNYSSYIVTFDCIKVNSAYVVVAVAERGYDGHSKLFVYDLECLKQINAVPTHLRLTTIEVKDKVEAMMMNESKIVCRSKTNMYVIYLKHIDRLRCPASC